MRLDVDLGDSELFSKKGRRSPVALFMSEPLRRHQVRKLFTFSRPPFVRPGLVPKGQLCPTVRKVMGASEAACWLRATGVVVDSATPEIDTSEDTGVSRDSVDTAIAVLIVDDSGPGGTHVDGLINGFDAVDRSNEIDRG